MLIRSFERGHVDHGWLNAHHTFSFSNYYNPKAMGFRSLRVINHDVVAAHTGFSTHSHNDMEIITFIISGELSHKDTLGNSSTIRPNEIQIMSAGSGIAHSEMNSSSSPTELLQVWIRPNQIGLSPSYFQKNYSDFPHRDGFKLLASHDARLGSAKIYQDADLYLVETKSVLAQEVTSLFGHAWIHVLDGTVSVNQIDLNQHDSLGLSETTFKIQTSQNAKFLLFDLA
jgi:quercetin 2,3-dioxygenase